MGLWRDLLFPFAALWQLIKLVFWPAAITGAAWWILGAHSPAFVPIALVCSLWALVLFGMWRLRVRSIIRRGTVRVYLDGRRGGRR